MSAGSTDRCSRRRYNCWQPARYCPRGAGAFNSVDLRDWTGLRRHHQSRRNLAPTWIYFVFITPTVVCLNASSNQHLGDLGKQRAADTLVGAALVLLASAITIGYSHWENNRGAGPTVDEPKIGQTVEPSPHEALTRAVASRGSGQQHIHNDARVPAGRRGFPANGAGEFLGHKVFTIFSPRPLLEFGSKSAGRPLPLSVTSTVSRRPLRLSDKVTIRCCADSDTPCWTAFEEARQ